MKTGGYSYLASPYTGNEQANYEAAVKAAADLLAYGVTVFSPIVHSHPVAVVHNLPTDFGFWWRHDRIMLDRADSLIVLALPGWEKSHGVRIEIEYAEKVGLQVIYLEGVTSE